MEHYEDLKPRDMTTRSWFRHISWQFPLWGQLSCLLWTELRSYFSRTWRGTKKATLACCGDLVSLQVTLWALACLNLEGSSLESPSFTVAYGCECGIYFLVSGFHKAPYTRVCMHPCLSEQASVLSLCDASGSWGECSQILFLTPECNRWEMFCVNWKKVHFSLWIFLLLVMTIGIDLFWVTTIVL